MKTTLPTLWTERGWPELPTSFNQMVKRFTHDVERLFGDMGPKSLPLMETVGWMPEIEVLQEKGELIVRADLPGLKPEDVKVELTDDHLVIKGERRLEKEEKTREVYRSERSYGAFYRAIPLPEGAITDGVKAHFANGVLEIKLPVPPRIEAKAREVKIETVPTKETVKV